MSAYRVVRLPKEDGDGYSFTIRDVRFSTKGEPISYSEEPKTPTGATIDELRLEIGKMAIAANKFVLNDTDFPPKEPAEEPHSDQAE